MDILPCSHFAARVTVDLLIAVFCSC